MCPAGASRWIGYVLAYGVFRRETQLTREGIQPMETVMKPATSSTKARPINMPSTKVQPIYCMFCGTKVTEEGEAYYDHLRQSKACESAWRTWRENLLSDHPGGD